MQKTAMARRKGRIGLTALNPGLAAGLSLGLSLAVLPQAAAGQPVVQALPDPASQQLSDAMLRLSRNPDSVPALVEAGRASLQLGDITGAQGFFQRAQALAPGDGAVIAGLAMLALRSDEPENALALLERARAAGEDVDAYAADHGLAYDLVGDNARAQERYGVALSRGETPETIRRLALSYAIAGDRAASEAVLLPLLQRRDLAAYRTRAFALAILGAEDEALSITETMLPPRLAQRLAPYMRFMPQLTPPQQAAAANLGMFPDTASIGRDQTRLARRNTAATPAAATTPEQGAAAAAASGNSDRRLIPGGEPLGRARQASDSGSDRRGSTRQERRAQAMTEAAREMIGGAPQQDRIAAAEPTPEPARTPVQQAVATQAPVEQASAVPAPVEPPPPAPAQQVPEQPVPERPVEMALTPSGELPALSGGIGTAAPLPSHAGGSPAQEAAPQPSFSISEPGRPSGAILAAAEQEPEVSLAEAFADFTLLETDAAHEARPGAVDITAIDPVREVRQPPPPPPPPAHPSRQWVQVATGADIAAFRYDWRRIVRNAGGLLDGREPFTVQWNRTRRLVTGPFATAREAQAFVSELNAAGLSTFRFTSEEGEEVVPLPRR